MVSITGSFPKVGKQVSCISAKDGDGNLCSLNLFAKLMVLLRHIPFHLAITVIAEANLSHANEFPCGTGS